MLISMGTPPKEITSIQLGLHNESEIFTIEVMINEKQISSMNKASKPCNDQENFDFTNCSQHFLTSLFHNKMDCIIPGKYIFITKLQL